MRASLSVVTAAIVAGAAIATPLAVQQQLPVFRAEANYVEVTARVVDKDGKFIDGLTAKDFSLTEDRRRQTVEHVFRVDLPTPWNKTAAVKPVVYRPGLPNEMQVAEGRIYLLYLNSVPAAHIVATRLAAHQFVNEFLQPEDIMAVWSTFTSITFTNDKSQLNARIDEFLGTSDLMSPVAEDRRPGRTECGTRHCDGLVQWCPGPQEGGAAVLGGWSASRRCFRTSRFRRRSPQTCSIAPTYRSTRWIRAVSASPPGLSWASGRQRGGCGKRGDVKFAELLQRPVQHEVAGGRQRRFRHPSIQTKTTRVSAASSTRTARTTCWATSRTQRLGPNWDYRELSVKLADPKLKGARVQVRKGYIARR